jgi:hypothetical protein
MEKDLRNRRRNGEQRRTSKRMEKKAEHFKAGEYKLWRVLRTRF